jgi:hypothetical protein
MIKLHSVSAFVFFGFIAILFSGCSGNAKVTGHIQFEDGTPLTAGEVVFESDTLQARGLIDASGRYVLESSKKGDGVPPGLYRVGVNAVEPTGKQIAINPRDPTDTRPEMRSLVDSKFTNPSTSGLTCEVKGSMKFDFKVSKPPAGQ